MKWKKYTLETTTGAVDFLGSMFEDIGIEGIEIEDNVPLTEADTRGVFVDTDIFPELPPDDGTAKVSFYLGEDEDCDAVLVKVREGLEELANIVDIGAGTITESETEDEDWINNWKEYFKPFTVGDILIKPTWEEIPEEYADNLCIQIDPGTAFGSGQHETTQLCIMGLREYVKSGMKVLDVGTGSGILGITAIKLGASHVFATDLDPNAVNAVNDNIAANDIKEDEFEFFFGNIIDDKEVQDAAGYETYDIIVANILADVIIKLQAEIPAHMKHGGVFVSSGIIDTMEDEVRAALESNPELEIIDETRLGEWVSFTAIRV